MESSSGSCKDNQARESRCQEQRQVGTSGTSQTCGHHLPGAESGDQPPAHSALSTGGGGWGTSLISAVCEIRGKLSLSLAGESSSPQVCPGGARPSRPGQNRLGWRQEAALPAPIWRPDMPPRKTGCLTAHQLQLPGPPAGSGPLLRLLAGTLGEQASEGLGGHCGGTCARCSFSEK